MTEEKHHKAGAQASLPADNGGQGRAALREDAGRGCPPETGSARVPAGEQRLPETAALPSAFAAFTSGGLWRYSADCLWLGLAGGVILGAWLALAQSPAAGLGAGLAYAVACAWLALNFSALALLLLAITAPKRPSRWFIFALACAKLPISYLLLFWLFTGSSLAPVYLVAGIASLPVVLVCRGIADARVGRDKPERKVNS